MWYWLQFLSRLTALKKLFAYKCSVLKTSVGTPPHQALQQQAIKDQLSYSFVATRKSVFVQLKFIRRQRNQSG